MGLLESGEAWLEGQRLAHLTVPALYCRADGTALAVSVTHGSTRFTAENDTGVTVVTESRDFIVASGELGFEPECGDVILDAGRRYDVLAPHGEDVWRWTGPEHLALRIHTKEAGTE